MNIEYHNDGKCKHQSWEATIHVQDDSLDKLDTFINGYGATKLEAHRNLAKQVRLTVQQMDSTIWELQETMKNAQEPAEETKEERAERLGWY